MNKTKTKQNKRNTETNDMSIHVIVTDFSFLQNFLTIKYNWILLNHLN